MVQRKRIDQRPEAQSLRALRDGGKEHAGRGGEAERRRMMFGGMIGVKAATIVGLDDFQPLRVEGLQRQIVAIEMVENAEFHSSPRLLWPGPRSAIIVQSPRSNKPVELQG